MHDNITVTEACAVLQLDVEDASLLLAGPFGPHGGLFHVRQVLGAAMIQALPMLKPEVSVAIALTVAKDARAEQPHRLLCVGWRADGTTASCWVGEAIKTTLRAVALVMPVDLMFAEVLERLAQHRAAASRLN